MLASKNVYQMDRSGDDLARFDIEPLTRVIARVEKALRIAGSPYAKDPELAEEFRQSTIQTFGYTYELAVKTLLRFLRYLPAVENPESLSFPQLLRIAHEQRLLSAGIERWTIFRTMRNRTSYIYRDEIAAEVFANVPEFLREACFLRDELRKRISTAS